MLRARLNEAASPCHDAEHRLGPDNMSDIRHKVFEGQLNKFTNVVKGWQYRWFVLNPETGVLDYYLMDDGGGSLGAAANSMASSSSSCHINGNGNNSATGTGLRLKTRGSQHLAGALVVPSEEDCHTFSVIFASGETYKLRAINTKERQIWVDRIRYVVQLHDTALLHSNPHLSIRDMMKPTTPPPGARSHLSPNGRPMDSLQHLSLSILDAYGSVHDILHQTESKHLLLAGTIEGLPLRASGHDQKAPSCLDQDLLILKATSQAALQSVESALTVLQDVQDRGRHEHRPQSSAAKSPVNANPLWTASSASSSPQKGKLDKMHPDAGIQSATSSSSSSAFHRVLDDSAKSMQEGSPLPQQSETKASVEPGSQQSPKLHRFSLFNDLTSRSMSSPSVSSVSASAKKSEDHGS